MSGNPSRSFSSLPPPPRLPADHLADLPITLLGCVLLLLEGVGEQCEFVGSLLHLLLRFHISLLLIKPISCSFHPLHRLVDGFDNHLASRDLFCNRPGLRFQATLIACERGDACRLAACPFARVLTNLLEASSFVFGGQLRFGQLLDLSCNLGKSFGGKLGFRLFLCLFKPFAASSSCLSASCMSCSAASPLP